MARDKTTAPKALSREHRAIWWDAYRDAFQVALRKNGETLGRSLPAIRRLAREAAWAALDDYKQAVKGDRS